ncbi:UNVERIFIED_CONTAM: hypothetical protein NY603_19455, partial [Bacteroidetes bacterium 56_B9]
VRNADGLGLWPETGAHHDKRTTRAGNPDVFEHLAVIAAMEPRDLDRIQCVEVLYPVNDGGGLSRENLHAHSDAAVLVVLDVLQLRD